ncbi:hypothetical protein phiOC_p011 [Ochrobactrum phage vB_OspM_OC]|nr:hypothetical protein phiOC_p011 [Ochrobactrum phage vB_OspM_OC]
MRYNEDNIVEELKAYIEKTYSEHYVKRADGIEGKDIVQYLDTIFQKGNNRGTYFCVDTAGKYVNRYGEKAGHNRKDLMKALHYLVLAIYNHDKDNKVETKPLTTGMVKTTSWPPEKLDLSDLQLKNDSSDVKKSWTVGSADEEIVKRFLNSPQAYVDDHKDVGK